MVAEELVFKEIIFFNANKLEIIEFILVVFFVLNELWPSA
jgi:hypothetical protein